MAKKHWTQTVAGRKRMSEIQKIRYARKKKVREEMSKAYKAQQKQVDAEQTGRMELIVFANNTEGGIDRDSYQIENYGEAVHILYEKYAGIAIHEVRIV